MANKKNQKQTENESVVTGKRQYFVPSERRQVEAESTDEVVEILKAEEDKKGSEK